MLAVFKKNNHMPNSLIQVRPRLESPEKKSIRQHRTLRGPLSLIFREDAHYLDMDEEEIRFEDVDCRDYE